MGARYYCPWLARWLAPDPINSEWYNLSHDTPTRNLERQFVELTASSYEYCYANPVRFIDPTGEQPPHRIEYQNVHTTTTTGVNPTPAQEKSTASKPVQIPHSPDLVMRQGPSRGSSERIMNDKYTAEVK